MAAGLIFDFHLGNKKFTAVINITFYFDAGAYVKFVAAVALNLCTSVSFESLASDNPTHGVIIHVGIFRITIQQLSYELPAQYILVLLSLEFSILFQFASL